MCDESTGGKWIGLQLKTHKTCAKSSVKCDMCCIHEIDRVEVRNGGGWSDKW